jgi:hypothetical protein
MSEIAFPLVGVALFVSLVLPACALLAKYTLVLLEHTSTAGPLGRLESRYLVLVGSSALPYAWFFSACVHQVDSGRAALACLFKHAEASFCLEPGFFVLILGVTAAALGAPAIKHCTRPRPDRSVAGRALEARVTDVIAHAPELRGLRGRVRAVAAPGLSVATYGLFRPAVYLEVGFASAIDDAMLRSALGHECEHVRERDPMRYLLMRLSLAINPFGRRLLEPHRARWLAAREANCDREAVVRGVAPLPLAAAIVRAAKPATREAVALGARELSVLEFRIAMLLAFTEDKPCAHRERGAVFPIAAGLLAIALLLPHQAGSGALDALHVSTEHAVRSFTH